MNSLRLKEIRKDKYLLQKDIGKILNISQVQYNRYESVLRLIPLYKINILADFYDVSIDYLVCHTDERKPYKKSKV